jgi:hypothetical protein
VAIEAKDVQGEPLESRFVDALNTAYGPGMSGDGSFLAKDGRKSQAHSSPKKPIISDSYQIVSKVFTAFVDPNPR